MKKWLCLGLVGGLILPLAAHSEEVLISDVESPEFTEIRSETDGAWHILADFSQLEFPLAAQWKAGSGTELLIKINNQQYVISRADVELAGEEIVTSACDTVPLAIANNSTSVSVKGAGEACD